LQRKQDTRLEEAAVGKAAAMEKVVVVVETEAAAD
jgi:hypothetical protein